MPKKKSITAQKNIFGQFVKPPRKKRDSSKSNNLTSQIIKIIQWKYGDAWRIQKGQVKAKTGLRPVGMENGLPDLIACIQGRFIGIEVKIGADKMSIYQESQKQRMLKAGGLFFIAKTLEETE